MKGPVHEVEISKGYWLGTYEVTQGQWQAVMGTTPWSRNSYVVEDPSHPAVVVSWLDVQDFLVRLNEAEGAIWYRLPTEAEWEYACRAGTQTRWSFGDNELYAPYYEWYSYTADAAGESYAHAGGSSGWRIPGACATCTATCGSGCTTGTMRTITTAHPGSIRPDLPPAPAASSGAVTTSLLSTK